MHATAEKWSNYTAFGMTMPGRTYATNVGGYKYGFNGKEYDVETNSGAQDFGAREYDNRLGRWWSTDPHQAVYPNQSPYSSFYNSPIFFIDGDGRDNVIYIVNFSKGQPDLDINNASNELQIAIDAIMGSDKVKVVVIQPEEFDKTKLDNTDVVIAYGDIGSVKEFAGDNLDYKLYSTNPNTSIHEYTNDELKLAGIIDSKVKDFQSHPYFLFNKEAFVRSGNSAQDWLVLTMLHVIGHVSLGGEHTNTGLDLSNGRDVDVSYDIYSGNFMLDGNGILTRVSLYNPWDKSNPYYPKMVRDGLNFSLKTFRDFTYATWNKHVFGKSFTNTFSSVKPNAKMKPSGESSPPGTGNTTYYKGNKKEKPRAKFED